MGSNVTLLAETANLSKEQIQHRNALVEQNIRLVERFATQFASCPAGQNAKKDDIMQMGYLGLIEAAHRYDPNAGYKFSTYAVRAIRHTIHRELEDCEQHVRIPSHVHACLRKAFLIRKEIFYESGIEPTLQEIAKVMQIPAFSLQNAFDVIHNWKFYSIDDPKFSPEFTSWVESKKNKNIEYFVRLEAICADLRCIVEKLDRFCQKFPKKAFHVNAFKRRYGLIATNFLGKMTLEEVGGTFKVTRERIRQLCAKVWKMLKGLNTKFTEDWFFAKMESVRILQNATGIKDSELQGMIFGNHYVHA